MATYQLFDPSRGILQRNIIIALSPETPSL